MANIYLSIAALADSVGFMRSTNSVMRGHSSPRLGIQLKCCCEEKLSFRRGNSRAPTQWPRKVLIRHSRGLFII